MNANRILGCRPLALGACLVLSLAALHAAEGSKKRAGEPQGKVVIVYDSPTDKVTITDAKLEWVQTAYQWDPDHPEYQVPIGVHTEVTTAALCDGALRDLIGFAESAKFFDLDDEYGGRPGTRAYTYRISVRTPDHGQKTVTYRSRPDVPPRPQSFARVEQRLLQVAREAKGTPETRETGKPHN
jgi:hypothetical protein